MKLCFSCRQLSSSRDLTGESLFCPHCGLSFGVRRCTACKKKPSSPLNARYCVHCGGQKLTDATPYLEMGWLSQLFTWGVLLLVLLWIVLPLARWMGSGLRASAGFQSPLVWLVESCASLLIVFFMFYFLSALIPGEAGTKFRGFINNLASQVFINNLASQVLKFGFSLLHKGTAIVFKLLAHWIGGTKTKP